MRWNLDSEVRNLRGKVSRFVCYNTFMKKGQPNFTMIHVMSNPKYKGKHVVVIGGKIFTAKTGNEANKLLDKLEKQYPHETPAITYIPKEDTLILWL